MFLIEEPTITMPSFTAKDALVTHHWQSTGATEQALNGVCAILSPALKTLPSNNSLFPIYIFISVQVKLQIH